MIYTKEQLDTILKAHKRWLHCEPDGVRADLREANLCGAILREADLREANLCGAILREADLREAKLYGADLWGADLRGANLRETHLYGADLCGADLYGANLRGAILREADLHGADLRGTDLREAKLYGANLCEANLCGADLRGAHSVPPIACPEKGSFTAFKKVAGGLIVELLIPEDARRSSATSRKCRCDKATVVSITNRDGTPADVDCAVSNCDKSFEYRVGEQVSVDDFCEDRWKECAPGIHFFITRDEAVNYFLC